MSSNAGRKTGLFLCSVSDADLFLSFGLASLSVAFNLVTKSLRQTDTLSRDERIDDDQAKHKESK